MSKRIGTFEWEGEQHEIARLTAFEMEHVFGLQEEYDAAVKDEDSTPRDLMRRAREIIEAMKCPEEIVRSIYPDDYLPLLTALMAAQNPFAGAEPSDPPAGDDEANASAQTPPPGS